jgi:hypothetical protein
VTTSGIDEDHLIERIRERAGDPERRLEARPSQFAASVASLDLRGLGAALGAVTSDLRRLLADPLAPPADITARADQLGAAMEAPVEAPLPRPATPEQVAAAEAALGVPLPGLLRRLYLEVANGGFGPGYGIVGLPPDGWQDDRRDLVRLQQVQRGDPDDADPARWRWPPTLLALCSLGDVVYACVDASRPGAPVLEYDPSDLDWDDDGWPLDEASALVEVRPSLASWLEDWLASPSPAEVQAGLAAGAEEAMRAQMRTVWAGLSAEEREAYGITDEMLRTGHWDLA